MLCHGSLMTGLESSDNRAGGESQCPAELTRRASADRNPQGQVSDLRNKTVLPSFHRETSFRARSQVELLPWVVLPLAPGRNIAALERIRSRRSGCAYHRGKRRQSHMPECRHCPESFLATCRLPEILRRDSEFRSASQRQRWRGDWDGIRTR